jgi:predicted RNA-binding protein YlqC (UPF0109 family)
MLTIMEAALAIQEFIEYVVIQLIDHPEDAAVIHEADEDGGNHHEYWLRLNQEDVGRVIGRNGSTIAAIRSLAMAAAQKNDLRVAVEIEEDEEEAARHRNERDGERGDRDRRE